MVKQVTSQLVVVCQGYIISSLLFNIYVEIIIRYVLEKLDKGINIDGWKVTNLRYANNIEFIAGTTYDPT